jgi:hypothetical protein
VVSFFLFDVFPSDESRSGGTKRENENIGYLIRHLCSYSHQISSPVVASIDWFDANHRPCALINKTRQKWATFGNIFFRLPNNRGTNCAHMIIDLDRCLGNCFGREKTSGGRERLRDSQLVKLKLLNGRRKGVCSLVEHNLLINIC